MSNDQQHKWVDEMDSEWEALKKAIVKIAKQHHKNKLKELGIKVDETGKIVKAVNNTYGEGIDPEAAGDMKGALIHSRGVLKKQAKNNCSCGRVNVCSYHSAIEDIDKILKKAEINE